MDVPASASTRRCFVTACRESLDEEGRKFLQGLKERDNPFPDIDYRVFAARQGQPLLGAGAD